jgi:hypothetical protein
MTALQVHGITVPDVVRKRILAEKDPARVDAACRACAAQQGNAADGTPSKVSRG